MKKYNEIVVERNETYKELQLVKKESEKLHSSIVGTVAERVEKLTTMREEITAADRKEKDLELTMLFQKNNAKIAAFNEFLPVVLEVWNKYSNKPYGEKTKQKIYTEIKERCNCSFYVHNGFNITPLNEQCRNTDYNFTCGTKYENGNNKPLLVDNKIQKLDFDDFELYYININYVTDVPETIENIRKLEAEAIAKQEELKKICERFNALSVDGIERIYCNKHIYRRL